MRVLTRFLPLASVAFAVNVEPSHQVMTQDTGGAVSNVLGSIKSRSKQLAQSIPGSSIASCLTSSNPELCKKQVRFEHDLRGLMLKGTTDLASMQSLKQKLTVPSAYGLDAAQANDIFHQLIKELHFDQQAYELVTNAAKATTPMSPSISLPTVAPIPINAGVGAAAVSPGIATAISPFATTSVSTLAPSSGVLNAAALTTAAPTASTLIASVSTTASTAH